MKKLLSLILALSLAACIFTSCGNNSDVPDGMKLASGEAVSYDLYIPEDWVIDLQTGITTAHVSDTDKTNVSATSYELENTNSTVDDWWEINVSDMNVAFTDIKDINIGNPTVLDGINGKEYIYSAKLGGVEHTYHQVAAVQSGGIVYIITYTSTPETYESNLETFNKITSEFRFK